jgi:hypothetical protein
MTWLDSLRVAEVVKVIDALILMLKSEWESTNFDMKFDRE